MDPAKESEDPREPHQYDENQPASQEILDKLGVLHWKFEETTSEELRNSPKLERIRYGVSLRSVS